jgi:hypothetical protein
VLGVWEGWKDWDREGARWRAKDQNIKSAIYIDIAYNSCGCKLRLSEVRPGSFEVDLGWAWGSRPPQIKLKHLDRN